MKVGVVFPQAEIGADPLVIRDFAQAVEELGFSHLVAFDHVLGADRSDRDPPLWGPYGLDDQFHEPFTLFSYLAGLTRRIELVTGVLVLPQRQTALVAKQAAQVAILSSGRLRLGVGVGWNPVEYEALGVPFDGRGERQEEQIEVLRMLWGQPVVDHTGRHHRIDRAGLRPRPPAPIPVWLGGFSSRTHERAARLADGFIFSRPREADGGAEGVVAIGRRMRARVEELGRDSAAFGLEARLTFGLDADADAAAAEIELYRVAGFGHAAVNTMKAGLGSPAAHLAAVEAIARETPRHPDRRRPDAGTAR